MPSPYVPKYSRKTGSFSIQQSPERDAFTPRIPRHALPVVPSFTITGLRQLIGITGLEIMEETATFIDRLAVANFTMGFKKQAQIYVYDDMAHRRLLRLIFLPTHEKNEDACFMTVYSVKGEFVMTTKLETLCRATVDGLDNMVKYVAAGKRYCLDGGHWVPERQIQHFGAGEYVCRKHAKPLEQHKESRLD